MFIFWAFLRVDDREILTVKRGSLRVNKESRWRTLGSDLNSSFGKCDGAGGRFFYFFFIILNNRGAGSLAK